MKKLVLLSLISIFSLSFSMKRSLVKEKEPLKSALYELVSEGGESKIIKKVDNETTQQRPFEGECPGKPIYIKHKLFAKNYPQGIVLIMVHNKKTKLTLLDLLDGTDLYRCQRNAIETTQRTLNFQTIIDSPPRATKHYALAAPNKIIKVILETPHYRKTDVTVESDEYEFGWPAFKQMKGNGLVSVLGYHKESKKQHLLLFSEALKLLYTAKLTKKKLSLETTVKEGTGPTFTYDLTLLRSPKKKNKNK